ncbi:hypothetical protein LUZ60_012615 [Juncus effusus]|nr:hypothetical protein LUZ60_012615 [Juncus effusus]
MMQMLGFGGSGSASKNRNSTQSSPSDSTSALISSSPSSLSRVSSTGGLGRPLRLVYCDEKGRFQLDPEAVAALQLVKGPVGVVSVCGRARQGKSFILNQILGRSSGFQVASTHKPCTKGLWMWSSPIKKTALDGTEYSLLLLDTEGIDAYDQTGTYSVQIFSLAVLLSSLFIYNQMGGIDETALDRLSLVTEMTKHIRVRATGGKSTVSELGQFSPVFVWLLRDFYLDLAEENRKITPRDYLELALRPIQGRARDISAKNEIRESIRALFPDRECFTLVRPLNNENDLQRLDQIPLERLRDEFRAGLDELTKYVFERTRPKQVGSTVMTGPILAGLTQSFLDAINNGAVPTISSSWQSVEESECRRAYDSACETYMSSFDRNKPAEEDSLREAHQEALQKSIAAFNATAVGAGLARVNYEKQLNNFCRKAFEDYKRSVFLEADKKCSDKIQSMENELRAACLVPSVKITSVIELLEKLIFEYESSCHGPSKWRILATFLKQCLEGQILDLCTKQVALAESQKSALSLKSRSDQDKLQILSNQLASQESHKTEYLNRYEQSITQKQQITQDLSIRISNLKSKQSTLESRIQSLTGDLQSSRLESSNWKLKFNALKTEHKTERQQLTSQLSNLQGRLRGEEGKYEGAKEQARSSQVEAEEWRGKYEVAANQARAALERAALVQDKINAMAQERVDGVRAEFDGFIAEKEEEIKDLSVKYERAESRASILVSQLEDAESQLRNHDAETKALKDEIKELISKLDVLKSNSSSYEKEGRILEKEKSHLEEKYMQVLKKAEETERRYKEAENDAKRAIEIADVARADVIKAQEDKTKAQELSIERLTILERVQNQVDLLEREKTELFEELQIAQKCKNEAMEKINSLERRFEEKEWEIEELLKQSNVQRTDTVQVLNELLKSERIAKSEAEKRAENLSLQLQIAQGKLDSLHQEMTTIRVMETTFDGKLNNNSSQGKRISSQDKGKGKKRSKLDSKYLEDGGSVYKGEENDYLKLTIAELKQELINNGCVEFFETRNCNKKDLIELYEKHVLKK